MQDLWPLDQTLHAKPSPARFGFARRPNLRDARLVSGLVMGFFALTHFSNHALGIVSLQTMEAARMWFIKIWAPPLGQFVLYGSITVHVLLTLLALYRRQTLRMPWREAAQIAFGLAIPFMMISHVTSTRIELLLTGHVVGYPEEVRKLWVVSPLGGGLWQSIALLIVWLHVCFGIWFWLRGRIWFMRAAPALYTVALLLPVLALLGFAEAGKEVTGNLALAPEPKGDPRLETIKMGLHLGFAALIGGVFLARSIRALRERIGRIRVTYPNGRVVLAPPGYSVLEISRLGDIPHLSTCGGRGRCSTCRVRIIEGADKLLPPGQQERVTLTRIRAAADVRLACQLRPTADLSVVPVLSGAPAWLPEMRSRGPALTSQEREVAVLFCDLRGFTRLTERRLPYDTVFLLNRYFETVGAAVEGSGGYLDKFIGDGALALFGLHVEPDVACRQALAAASRIAQGLEEINQLLRHELGEPLRIAMGLHAGPAIVGNMGYGLASSLTAIGDTINAASRLEGIAKEMNAELVVSLDLTTRARVDLSGHDQHTISVRGRAAPVQGWIMPKARELEALVTQA